MDIYFVRDDHGQDRIATALENHRFVDDNYIVLLELVNDYPLKRDFESLAAQVCEEKEFDTDKTALSAFIQNCNKVFCFDTADYDEEDEPCLERHNVQFKDIKTTLTTLSRINPEMPVIVIVGEAHLNNGEVRGWISHEQNLRTGNRTHFLP